MSPEQAKGKQVDRRADIWSFGVVLYEMLAGRQLYEGETVAETLAAVLMKDPALDKLPAATPPGIRKLLARCLDKDPKRRLRDIGEARIAIEEALTATPEEITPPPRASSSRLVLASWIVTALASVAAAALAWTHFREKPPPPAQPIRFTLAPPENYAFTPGLALSPDSSKLVFGAQAEGRRMLWLRPLDSLTAQPLPGTEGGSDPFWSPDGRFIGFFADRKLKKIDTAGGPPQVICETPSVRGGAWGPDGTILIGGMRTILRVSAAGGVPRPATEALPADIGHDWPAFLPDGRHFIYQRRVQSDDQGLYLGVLGSGFGVQRPETTNRLVPTTKGALYAPAPGRRTGYLVFQREAALMAQPFDPGRLQITGEPVPVGDFGLADPRSSLYSVSNNGILVTRGSLSAGVSQFLWFRRSGESLGVVAEVDLLSHPSFSPDETQLVWNGRSSQSANYDLWTTDLARQATSRFSFDPSTNDFPVWSPAGDYIYFGSSRGGAWGLYRRLASGAGSDQLLYQSANWKSPASVWPGHFLFYGELDAKSWDIWALPESGERKPIPLLQTPFNEMHPQISADGKWIAYTSDETGRNEVYVQPFPVSGAKVPISTAGGTQPRWRQDGKELFYLAPDGKIMAVEIRPGAVLQAGRPQPLFQTHGPSFSNVGFTYAVTHDGQRFLVNTQRQERQSSPPINVVVNWTATLK